MAEACSYLRDPVVQKNESARRKSAKYNVFWIGYGIIFLLLILQRLVG